MLPQSLQIPASIRKSIQASCFFCRIYLRYIRRKSLRGCRLMSSRRWPALHRKLMRLGRLSNKSLKRNAHRCCHSAENGSDYNCPADRVDIFPFLHELYSLLYVWSFSIIYEKISFSNRSFKIFRYWHVVCLIVWMAIYYALRMRVADGVYILKEGKWRDVRWKAKRLVSEGVLV